MTYHREISPKTVRLGVGLSRGTLEFTSVSRNLSKPVSHLGRWSPVPNGVPVESYRFQATVGPQAPLVFLGRIEAIKGPHLAIEVARRSGLPLVLAGNVPDAHRAWFEAEVQPHIDGERVRYVGPVDDQAKSDLLSGARALLMPILWEEPFGMVMVEAMACGTPVIALDRGAVREVVDHGVTGFVCDDVDAMVGAVENLGVLDRQACRDSVTRRFSADAVVEAYLAVYRDMLARRGRGPALAKGA